MADKQSGTGARGNSQRRPRGQGSSDWGNDTKASTNNRSQQTKQANRSSASNDNVQRGRTGTNQS